MLLRFLALAGLCLGRGVAALAPQGHGLPSNIQTSNTQHSRHFYKIDIPCSHCAFSDTECSQNPESKSHVTIDISSDNGTLYANHESVFPPSLPMQFSAVKHSESGDQSVQVAYSLDARPFPAQPGALLGETFLLKLRLFDLHGRPVTPDLIAVAVSRRNDGTLSISKVERSPFHRHGHGHMTSSWRLLKSHIKPYLDQLARVAPEEPRHHRRPLHADIYRFRDPASHYHNTMPWSSRDRSFMRLVRPVILPALLGVAAGLCACLVGFVVGKMMISLCRCWYVRSGRGYREVPAITIDSVVLEDNLVSEKENLSRSSRWLDV
ncbi:hypothetical protein CNMCM6936_005664 [Aspergillus lentulus]|uniref:Uncharacterized protein n=1 Tax=Aspergillus lentulus TaxID=293939 RepID=A0AAN5YQ13_ASPLE|nr:hypothetical protein CNMCM6936_005664 [Aspergillus lentulus]KAF4174166.1 hypothetical protein CNMCM8060_008986 [Aspergillus lentulus]KAF4192057.1 hypothetical protein CNMCM8694_000969 [Aspergillus lentulus]KAF4205792.1 hypothetical protein CNMCM8927_005678 [Aspergillus lentulus]GFG11461.1 hypothetical protein IFM61392_06927 [Aspergillus lentulus]